MMRAAIALRTPPGFVEEQLRTYLVEGVDPTELRDFRIEQFQEVMKFRQEMDEKMQGVRNGQTQ
jgi:hypothetical protein